MRRHNRKLIAFYVYHMLGIPNPMKFKYKWMDEWIIGSKHFEDERELAERIVGLYAKDT